MIKRKESMRVKITNKDSQFYGFVGRATKNDADHGYGVLFNNECKRFYIKNDFKEVEPSFDTLLVGDIVVDHNDDKAKVLEVGVNTFLKSYWNDFNTAGGWYTFKKAKQYGLKVEGQSTKVTQQQVDDKFGYPVEISSSENINT